jgi:hypothetical protein
MRRLLLVVTAILLICGALATGMLAADWPFWRRAIAWQQSPDGLPVRLPGSRVTIGAGAGAPLPDGPLPEGVDGAALAALSRSTGAVALLLAQDGRRALALFREPGDAARPLEGGGLVPLLLLPVYAGLVAGGQHDLLDRPLGGLLAEWDDADPRAAITPRQLFRHQGGLAAPPFRPLNPFSDRARLASGPDFDRAALRFPAAWPPGTRVSASPADAQLLALAAERLSGRRYVTLLEEYLWRPLGLGSGEGLLDHRRGRLAAHCCVAARADDWLKIAQLIAGGEEAGAARLPAGFDAELLASSAVAPERGLGLARLLTRDGRTVLELATAGRWLVADPSTHRALVWFGSRPLLPDERAALLRAAGW